MHTLSIRQLATGLQAKKFSSRALVAHILASIDRHDGKLNSYVTVCGDAALKAGEQADAARAQGGGGPLAGVPLAHKDIFCTDGVRTACGSRMLDKFIAPYD